MCERERERHTEKKRERERDREKEKMTLARDRFSSWRYARQACATAASQASPVLTTTTKIGLAT